MTTERDIQNYISYAREKGLEEGMEKGMEKGREEGREEGRIEAARNMLADEISIDLVAKYFFKMHGAGAFFSSRPAPYFYYKYRIIRYLHFYRGAGPEHFFAPAPFDLRHSTCAIRPAPFDLRHLCMHLTDRPREAENIGRIF